MASLLVVKKNTVRNNNERVEEWNLSATFSTSGSFTSTAIVDPESQHTNTTITGWLAMGETDPGATVLSTDYDVTVLDSRGVDVFGGEMTNRSGTLTEQVMPKMGNAYGERWVNSDLTLAIANNTAASGTTEVRLIVRKGTM